MDDGLGWLHYSTFQTYNAIPHIPHLGAWKSTMSCTSFFFPTSLSGVLASCSVSRPPSAVHRPLLDLPLSHTTLPHTSFAHNLVTYNFEWSAWHLRLALVPFVWQAWHLVTQCNVTQLCHTQLFQTQLCHTQLFHAQPFHTRLLHTQLFHTQICHTIFYILSHTTLSLHSSFTQSVFHHLLGLFPAFPIPFSQLFCAIGRS